MRVCVFTAIIGPNTDRLKEPGRCAPGVDYFCFTDQPIESESWSIMQVETEGDPVVQSRRLKIMAYPVWDAYDASLWIDASFRLLANPLDLADRWLFRHDFVALRHPERTTAEQEGAELIRLGRVSPELIHAQLERYRETLANQSVLTSTGFLLRRHAKRVHRWMKLWWREFMRGEHVRDQMSVDYALARAGLDVCYLLGHYRDNPYAVFYPQSKESRNA